MRKTALDAVGNFSAEHSDYLERDEMKNMYMVLLRMEEQSYLELKIQTLQTLELFLEIEEEKSIRMNAQLLAHKCDKQFRIKTYSKEQQEKMKIELVAQKVAQEVAMKEKEKESGESKAKFFERANKKGRKRAHDEEIEERLFERESTPAEVVKQRNAEWRKRQRRKADASASIGFK
ncbi:hypothetical protein QR680_001007 [Steinernema hermaphroditum]|uniref:Uncharacterized protein n=1 Tax=Steinernema hermaphroditum TaxID=289476 RepID=A0AA39GZF1_9BILA|nr:hypothetical protein QR680_001007 [Steinernema hermaphroditum]